MRIACSTFQWACVLMIINNSFLFSPPKLQTSSCPIKTVLGLIAMRYESDGVGKVEIQDIPWV